MAVFLADLGQDLFVGRRAFHSATHKRLRQPALHVLRDREDGLRLGAIALDDDGKRLETIECGLDSLLLDAAVDRLRLEQDHEIRERNARVILRGQRRDEQKSDDRDRSRYQSVVPAAPSTMIAWPEM